MSVNLSLKCKQILKSETELSRSMSAATNAFNFAQRHVDDIRAIDQPLCWYGGRLDRLAITNMMTGETPKSTGLRELTGEARMAISIAAMEIQCMNEFNRPMNVACSILHRYIAGEEQEVDCRALVIEGGILVCPEDAYVYFENIERGHKGPETINLTMGVLILPEAETAHEKIVEQKTKNGAIKFMQDYFMWPECTGPLDIPPVRDGFI